MTQNIIITGATGGIGTELTRLYARENHTLALIARDKNKLLQLIQTCPSSTKIHYANIDIRDKETLSAWLSDFDSKHNIDILISNAGVTCGLSKNQLKEDEIEAKRVIDINLQGTINTITPIVNNMISRKSGHIVIISSLAGLGPLADMPSYSASKAAIIAYGHSLRQWLKAFNINVTIICPGFVTSPMSKRHIGKKPFEISAERAAIKIKSAIDKKKRFYAFPLPLIIGIYFCKLMPLKLNDFFMKPFKAKIEKDPRF